MKAKQTRRALLVSALALVMCVSMLVGTTFAWFTDSVTSGRNIIQSGNLDVVLEYWNGTSYVEVDDTTKLFDDAALWEPGYTEVAYLKVRNNGSLALKYQLGVNIFNEIGGVNQAGGNFKLSDHLVFSVVDKEITSVNDLYTREDAVAAAGNAIGLTDYNSGTKALELNGDTDFVALIIYMPTTVDNIANHNGTNKPSIELGVNLFATQQTYEDDSFDNQYDKDAPVPVTVTNASQLASINGGDIRFDEAIVDNQDDSSSIIGYSALVLEEDAVLSGEGSLKNEGGYAVSTVTADTNLTIKDGTYEGQWTVIYVRRGDLVIEGGFFRNLQSDPTDNNAFLINMYDEACRNGEASVVIKGGTFVNWNPANNASEGAGTNFVPAGYTVVTETQDNGDVWYTVVAE